MADSITVLGLVAGANYEGQGVTVKHKDFEELFPLIRTTAKMLFVDDGSEKPKRVTLTKVEAVEIPEDATPEVKEDKGPEVSPFKLGLQTNTNYEGQNVEVKHEDKGWLPLKRTALKVAYVEINGEEKRMTLAKLVGIRGLDGQEEEVVEEQPEQATVFDDDGNMLDPEFDNDFNIGQDHEGLMDGTVSFD